MAPFGFGHRLVNAISLESPAIARLEVPCDPISKYTTQFFLDNRLAIPPEGTCLFYTHPNSKNANEYARESKDTYTTIWDLWPKKFYNDKLGDLNDPLRCIFKDDSKPNGDRQIYFENMSRAFAQLCSGDSLVMTNDPKDVPMVGIFGRIELPTARLETNIGGKVNLVEAIDPTGESKTSIWVRKGFPFPPSTGGKRARAPLPVPAPNGITLEQIAAFDDIVW